MVPRISSRLLVVCAGAASVVGVWLTGQGGHALTLSATSSVMTSATTSATTSVVKSTAVRPGQCDPAAAYNPGTRCANARADVHSTSLAEQAARQRADHVCSTSTSASACAKARYDQQRATSLRLRALSRQGATEN